jgi:hypothetical protein
MKDEQIDYNEQGELPTPFAFPDSSLQLYIMNLGDGYGCDILFD